MNFTPVAAGSAATVPAAAVPAAAASVAVAPRLGRVLTAVNLLAAFMATVSAVLAFADPAILGAPAVDSWLEIYAQAYVVRSVPIGLAVGAVLLVPALRTRPAVLVTLTVAGLAQVGDIAIGAAHGIAGMAVGATVGAVIHLGSVAVLARKR